MNLTYLTQHKLKVYLINFHFIFIIVNEETTRHVFPTILLNKKLLFGM